MNKLFEQYRDGKGLLVIAFNDGTTITGDFVKENDTLREKAGRTTLTSGWRSCRLEHSAPA